MVNKQKAIKKKQIIKYNSSKNIVNTNKTSIYKYYFLIAILILTTFVFSTSLNNEFTNFDDEKYVYENNYIKDFSFHGINEIFKSYFKDELPVTHLSFAIDYKLWGLNPLGYHIENLFWHLLNIILVFFLIRLITKKDNLALIVALLFAIHPTRCESVAWISERKDVLYTFFYLLSLITYIYYIQKQYKLKYYFLAFIFFTVSILSKYAAVILPFFLFAIDYYYNRKFNAKLVLEKIPFIIISVVSTTIHFILPEVISSNNIINADYQYYDRIFLGSYALMYYIFELILPLKLSLIHPYPLKANNLLPIEYYISTLVIILIISILIWLFRKNFKYKKDYILGIIMFILPLTLVLHIIPFGGNIIVGERYSYISYIGLFFILSRLYCNIIDLKPNIKIYLSIVLIFITACFSLITYNRNKVWKNSITLWTDVIEKYPCVIAYNNRGTAKMLLKDYTSAINDFDNAIIIKPDAYTYFSRGVSKLNLKDYRNAIEDINKGLLLSPDDFKAYDSRANARIQTGDYEGSLSDYNKVISLKPDYAIAYNNRGLIYFNLKKYTEAIKDYTKAIELDPNFENAYSNLGSTKGMMKDYIGSIDAFTKAIQINNKNDIAYYFRGFSKYNIKDLKGACEDWVIATQLGNSQSAQMLATYCK